MTVLVYTLGCRLNQCESEAIMDAFVNAGFSKAEKEEDAQIVVVNTCTVTSKAEQKARRMIRLFSKSAEAVIVTGCYAELDRDELCSLGPHMHVYGLKEKGGLLKLPSYLRTALLSSIDLNDAIDSFGKAETDPFIFDASSFSYHSRAYLKVQDGCDNACAYCRTTIARGPSVSLDVGEVVRRAKKIEAEGLHEIMLTGVNLTMYNHRSGGLGELTERLLDELGPDMRIRFSSLEADHVDDRLLECFKDKRIFPHFHLPIQSASNKVLKRVDRKYTIEHIEYIIGKMREYKDDPFIACDIIAGLPGEDDEDFLLTYDFLSRMGFAAFHVFPYSPREGTTLWGARDRVEERVRDERAEKLRALSAVLSRRYISRQEGRVLEVVAEKEKNGRLYGTTGNYLKVEIRGGDGIKEGDLLKGKVVSLAPLALIVD